MLDTLEILACPSSGESLRISNDGRRLITADGATEYRVDDGIPRLLPTSAHTATDVQQFYDETGWGQTDDGVFGDTKSFVDARRAPLEFNRRCMRRLTRHFRRGGRYLLDAGSGPIPHDELLAYGANFEKRICVDLSPVALRTARAKLGANGVYLQGDLTQLPLHDNTVDAVTCNHVIYQIQDPERQAIAFRELWRVLKPGGLAVVVYWWESAPLEWRLRHLARILNGSPRSVTSGDAGEVVHAPQSLDWFESQGWPFRYSFESYRAVTHHFMKTRIHDDWRGRLFLEVVFALQILAPTMCGKYGALPAILIFKD